MTDSEYKLRQAILNWMVAQAESYTHALTLTLKQSRKVKTERGELVERITRYSATTNMRHFINRLNAALYGNAAKAARGGKSIKLLGALEGGTTGDNLHYHCVIGRLPERLPCIGIAKYHCAPACKPVAYVPSAHALFLFSPP